MSDMLNQVLDALFQATNEKHMELGLRPFDRRCFDQLRAVPTNPSTPGFGGDVTEGL